MWLCWLRFAEPLRTPFFTMYQKNTHGKELALPLGIYAVYSLLCLQKSLCRISQSLCRVLLYTISLKSTKLPGLRALVDALPVPFAGPTAMT
jgi:hypothetical protein